MQWNNEFGDTEGRHKMKLGNDGVNECVKCGRVFDKKVAFGSIAAISGKLADLSLRECVPGRNLKNEKIAYKKGKTEGSKKG